MSESKAEKIAAKYLKDQAKIIAKYGEAPKLSGDSYQEAKSDAARTFQLLSSSKAHKNGIKARIPTAE